MRCLEELCLKPSSLLPSQWERAIGQGFSASRTIVKRPVCRTLVLGQIGERTVVFAAVATLHVGHVGASGDRRRCWSLAGRARGLALSVVGCRRLIVTRDRPTGVSHVR